MTIPKQYASYLVDLEVLNPKVWEPIEHHYVWLTLPISELIEGKCSNNYRELNLSSRNTS